jgi:hypothetical protein
VAEDLLDAVATAASSINDAPMDDLDYESEVWDGERYRHYERWRRDRDERWHSVVARHRASGALVGLTEVACPAGEGWLAYQGNTSVDAAHRGHRLGLILKLEMLAALPTLEPQVRVIDTWNAGSNAHMIAINEALGFTVLDHEGEWQRPVSGPGR